jgi:hypothetical protein
MRSKTVEQTTQPAKACLTVDALSSALWRCKTDKEALACLAASQVGASQLDDRDALGQTCLIKCAMRGHAGACKKLVALGADPNATSSIGEGALALAAIGGHLKAFEALLGLGADAAEVDNDGNGIIHKIFEAKSARTKTMLVLAIARGAAPDLPNKRGLTPLKMLKNLYGDADSQRANEKFEAYRCLLALGEGAAIAQGLAPSQARKATRARL